MKKYLVMFSEGSLEDNRIFSTRQDAKDFILNQFEKFLDWSGEHTRRLWRSISEVRKTFDEENGITDFANIFEIRENDTSDIDWEAY